MESQNSAPDHTAMREGVRAKERFSESLAALAGRLIARRRMPDAGHGKGLRERKSSGGAAA